MGCFGFASPFSTLPNITQLVRILHLNYKTTCFPWKNEGFGTTLATHSRDSPGGKAAHKTMLAPGAAPAGMDMHG
jgi:hypothetical protein